MLIRALHDCPEFTAGDNCRLRELLHPGKAALDLRYSLAHARVEPGAATTPHALRTSEVYYILQGNGCMHIDGESAPVQPGDTVYIPPHARQHIVNTGTHELVFICIVDPAWRAEDEVVF